MIKKIIVDILLFALMLLEFSKAYLPQEIHEIIGICLIILVIVHLILNRKYFQSLPKGKYGLKRSLMLTINVAFVISFLTTSLTGLLSSQATLTFLNIGDMTTSYLHTIFAYMSLIILGMHLGFTLTGLLKKIEKNKLTPVLYLGIIILGLYSLIDVDFLNHLTGNYGFGMTTKGIIINTLEYLSIVLMTTVIFHLIRQRLR